MSNIKGGGRAQLTNEAEESIIALLYDVRDHDNPLRLRSSTQRRKILVRFNDLSDHDKKKERRRFCKKLLKCHNQVVLTNKLNNAPLVEGEDGGNVSSQNQQLVAALSSSSQQHQSSSSSSDAAGATGKVRIELVEAVYKAAKKISKKDSEKESKKESKKKSWKEGSTRKTLVLPKSTLAKELAALCKTKLKMKTTTRLFVLDKDSKLEIDLTHDLSGLNDGSVVYATSYTLPPPSKVVNLKEIPAEVSEEQQPKDDIIFDPLESVKQAYKMHNRRGAGKESAKNIIPDKRPSFSSALDKLEPLSQARSQLPAAEFRSEILASLDSTNVIIISGATGCGKSTQVPQFILEGMKAIGCGEQANIVVTQPRRVAATSLAKRVADERNLPSPGKPGSEVGYNVRLAKAISKETRLVYCTVGVLLRQMLNPLESGAGEGGDGDAEGQGHTSVPLESFSHIVLDEVHERDLNTDFALTLLRPILAANKRISLILMSATASTKSFVQYFQNEKLGIFPKVFEIPGRTFPVQTIWLKECEKFVSGRMSGESMSNDDCVPVDCDFKAIVQAPRATTKIDNDFIVKIVMNIAQQQWNSDTTKNHNDNKENGAILIFLPGKGEIEALSRTMYNAPQLGNKTKCSILQLHSNLSPSEQYRAFLPVKHGIVKVILSTNVAETSVTIADVSNVIDTGRVKEMRFNSSTRIKELVTVWTSLASTKQRAGRAGRTSQGTCYKLYREVFAQEKLPAHTSPEILRSPLEELVLQVCLLEEQRTQSGASPMKFLANAPQPPSEENLQQACEHLMEIGALDTISCGSTYRLTPLGYHLAHLPLDAKVGKILVVGCILQCIEPALTIAASLSAPKSVWLPFIPGVSDSRAKARRAHEDIIFNGYGGANWSGGTVKGDIVASIAAYEAWSKGSNDKERRQFAISNALDHNALNEMKGLRSQFKDALKSSGLLQSKYIDNKHGEDALLTNCVVAAGLYPNIATLMRPSKIRRIRFARLITKNGDCCRPSSSSFQLERIRNCGESGSDAYAVYHGKHVTIRTSADANDVRKKQEPFLSDINFVPRFAILLFGGQINVKENSLIVDDWLKFKVVDDLSDDTQKLSDKTRVNAILVNEVRKELDNVMSKRIINSGSICSKDGDDDESERVISVVKTLLTSGK